MKIKPNTTPSMYVISDGEMESVIEISPSLSNLLAKEKQSLSNLLLMIREEFSKGNSNMTVYFKESAISFSVVKVKGGMMIVGYNLIDAKKQGEIDLHLDRLLTLGEMTAGIAHDINNPLGTILSGYELTKVHIEDALELSNLPQEARAALEKGMPFLNEIETGVMRVNKIVQGIKMLSTKEQIKFQDQDVISIINGSISVFKKFLDDHKITISLKSKSDKINISCKEVLISQVLANLIKNSADALENEVVYNKWIEIDVQEDSNYVNIYFSDGGKGIPLEMQEKIFERYYTSKEVGKGTGIGLDTCKQIMKAHSGDIIFHPHSKNTCFKISIYKHLKNHVSLD